MGEYYGPYEMDGTFQSYLSREYVVGSESWCNQQEFGRISLYQTMIRIWNLTNVIYDYKTGEMWDQDHTYSPLSSECHESTYLGSTQENFFLDSEPKLWDVWKAYNIILLWAFKWILDFVRIFGRVALKAVQTMVFMAKFVVVMIISMFCLVFM